MQEGLRQCLENRALNRAESVTEEAERATSVKGRKPGEHAVVEGVCAHC